MIFQLKHKDKHKYTNALEENVCPEHMEDILACMDIVLFTNKDEEVATSQSVRILEITAEYGIRILMDYIVQHVDSPKENRLNTINIMRDDLKTIRDRIDNILIDVEERIKNQ